METVKVILRDGSECTLLKWQKIYGLEEGSNKIGKYFSTKDSKIAENIKQYGKVVVNELLIRLLDGVREKRGKATILSSFNRSEAKQKQLQDNPNFAAATFSPHVVFMAADTTCSNKKEVEELAEITLLVAKELGIKIRVGWKEYLALKKPMFFVHCDVCPEFYGKGKPFHDKKHPWQWENEVTW